MNIKIFDSPLILTTIRHKPAKVKILEKLFDQINHGKLSHDVSTNIYSRSESEYLGFLLDNLEIIEEILLYTLDYLRLYHYVTTVIRC